MKGTIKRGINLSDDLHHIKLLKRSAKDKAENVMIVDLLRNDIGKISKTGSVQPYNLFHIEKYESLFQMVSSVKAELKKDISFGDIIKNLFPCGSVTGAPKIRTMEIINKLEQYTRGIYTGSAGIIGKKSSVFNVAIRTIKIEKETGKGEIGIGSGIVWDSIPEEEYKETLLKCNFLLKPLEYFEIIETMKAENNKITLLSAHIKRLKNAASYFLFRFDEVKIRKHIASLMDELDPVLVYRIRFPAFQIRQI